VPLLANDKGWLHSRAAKAIAVVLSQSLRLLMSAASITAAALLLT